MTDEQRIARLEKLVTSLVNYIAGCNIGPKWSDPEWIAQQSRTWEAMETIQRELRQEIFK